ncbi:phosphonate ABC transporter ATPase [Escherichia coli]|nr:phosphonate ABC transporter ATPase [Escherichia coli]
MQTIIRVEKLAKTFNQHQALHAVDLNIHHGEMVALAWAVGFRKIHPFTSLKRFDYRR